MCPGTTAQNTLPSRVGCSVMPVTHSRSGWGLAKSQSTRSAAAAILGTLRNLGGPETPRSPTRRISDPDRLAVPPRSVSSPPGKPEDWRYAQDRDELPFAR